MTSVEGAGASDASGCCCGGPVVVVAEPRPRRVHRPCELGRRRAVVGQPLDHLANGRFVAALLIPAAVQHAPVDLVDLVDARAGVFTALETHGYGLGRVRLVLLPGLFRLEVEGLLLVGVEQDLGRGLDDERGRLLGVEGLASSSGLFSGFGTGCSLFSASCGICTALPKLPLLRSLAPG